MNLQKLNDWLQLVAAIGVIVGLGMVAYELRQQHELAYAQLVSDSYNSNQSLLQSWQDEDNAAVFIKSIDSPESLTPEEQIVLQALFSEVVAEYVGRYDNLRRMGLFQNDPELSTSYAGGVVFASAYGRAWWDENRMDFPPPVRALMDRAATREYPLMNELNRIKTRALEQDKC